MMQQMMLVSPYRVVNHRAVSSFAHNVYVILMIVFFLMNIVLAMYFVINEGSEKLGFENGFLWGIIGIFELAFSNVSYPILVFHTLIYRQHQIDFLNKISDIDDTLEQFGINMEKRNYHHRWRSYFFIILGTVYFWILYYLIYVQLLPSAYYSKIGVLLLLMANQSEQGAMGMLTWAIIYYCSVIRYRFVLLQSINLAEILRSDDVKRSRKSIAKWLTVFRDLCQLIEDINTGWGFAILLRYSHDITLLISQLYLMYWIVEQGGHMSVLLFVVYWSSQNALKILGMGLSADMATRKVYDFK